jgi:hypothetical protein
MDRGVGIPATGNGAVIATAIIATIIAVMAVRAMTDIVATGVD